MAAPALVIDEETVFDASLDGLLGRLHPLSEQHEERVRIMRHHHLIIPQSKLKTQSWSSCYECFKLHYVSNVSRSHQVNSGSISQEPLWAACLWLAQRGAPVSTPACDWSIPLLARADMPDSDSLKKQRVNETLRINVKFRSLHVLFLTVHVRHGVCADSVCRRSVSAVFGAAAFVFELTAEEGSARRGRERFTRTAVVLTVCDAVLPLGILIHPTHAHKHTQKKKSIAIFLGFFFLLFKMGYLKQTKNDLIFFCRFIVLVCRPAKFGQTFCACISIWVKIIIMIITKKSNKIRK